MISRREFLGTSLGAGASLALVPELLRAFQQPGKLIQRAIPSSGEMLPVISFSPREEADNAAMKELLKTFAGNGGRVVDVLHGGPAGEDAGRRAANELGIQNRFFWTTPLNVVTLMLPGSGPPPGPDRAAIRAAIEEKLTRFKVPTIDLVLTSPTHLPVLREMKKEGRVRYIGLHALLTNPSLEAAVRNEDIDFVGTEYSVGARRVEQTLLPLVQERKIAFMAYFTFDRGRIFKRVGNTPLPEWAAEFDARTWPQFFLKYVLSHPAVTVARTGTTKAAHMLDNIGGGIGRLPDEAMRTRMAAFIDALPPTPGALPPGVLPPEMQQKIKELQTPAVVLSAATLDRYLGEYRHVVAGTIVTVRRDGDRLLLKSGTLQEGPLAALSETRFGLAGISIAAGPNPVPWIAAIEFQLDGQGKVVGAIVRQGLDGAMTFALERK